MLFVVVQGALQFLRGCVLYLRSGGAPDQVARAKNKIIANLVAFAGFGILMVIVWTVTEPTTAQVFKGMAVMAVISAGVWLFLSWTVVPTAVAAYSAWWMPKAERTAHRQDIRYALRQADWGRRSSHAWGVLKSSPRVGLRARRHHKRLAAAMTGPPVRRQVSS